jgi:hypothetical protein
MKPAATVLPIRAAAPPALPALPRLDGLPGLRVWCMYCQTWHLHGAGYGHRTAARSLGRRAGPIAVLLQGLTA